MPINKNALRLLSDEELREEVERRDYEMIRRRKRRVPEHCVCGNEYPSSWRGPNGIYFECDNCGLKTESFKTQRKAMLAWNELIENERPKEYEKNS